jgi:pyrroline-5-carboxylate reductase
MLKKELTMSTFGFIGTGNMGGALARAAAKILPKGSILLTNRTMAKAEALAEEIGAAACGAADIAADADFIFLGVKPQQLADCFAKIKDSLAGRSPAPVLVSMAAGTSIEKIKTLAGGDYPVIRIMPNTPVAIGEGIVLCCAGEDVEPAQLKEVTDALAPAGMLCPMDEAHLDAATSVSGCGPAFADLFAEALADGAVACGIPRKDAQKLAAQMLLGSARLMLESGKSPAELKDAVCSPGGTTIEGVRALENAGFRAAVIEAVIAAWEANAKFK